MGEIRGFRGEYYFLSNFSHSQFTIHYKGESFVMKTGEHGFHAAKVSCMLDNSRQDSFDYLEKMQRAPTPAKAKYLGRSVRIDPQRWDVLAPSCMRRVTELKYGQNPDLLELLLDTAPALLVEENTWGDTLWGTVNGVGKNQLGEILTSYRDSFISPSALNGSI